MGVAASWQHAAKRAPHPGLRPPPLHDVERGLDGELSMTRYTTHGGMWAQQRESARSMRRESTEAEDRLWDRLRAKRVGWKFRRQHPIGRFVVDFYCVERGVAIEVDGAVHESQEAEDQARQAYLDERGILFLRYTNETILQDIDRVVDDILGTLAAPAPPLHGVERGWPKAGGEVLDVAPGSETGGAR